MNITSSAYTINCFYWQATGTNTSGLYFQSDGSGGYSIKLEHKGQTNAAVAYTLPSQPTGFNHFVGTFDGSTGKIYMNGVEVASGNLDSKTDISNTIYIGGGYPYNNITYYRPVAGLDQVRIFNTALTAAQITELYEETDADSHTLNFPSGAGAVALYELNGNANDTGGTYNGTASNVTWLHNGVGFQPDLVWMKNRDNTFNHRLADSVRGATKYLITNLTNGESTNSQTLTSFDSNGFTVGSDAGVNYNNSQQVAWCWKAAELPAINNNGTITSVVSANPAAGFSIVSYTGTGANGSFGHGLSAAEMVIIKSRDQSTRNWITHFSSLGAGAYMSLNLTSENATSTARINTTTSTVVNIGTSANVNLNGDRLIAYCFHSVDGFSKIGSYVGSSASNSIVTGFEPAFVMIKRTNLAGGRWIMVDNKRGDGGFNVAKILNAQDSLAEFTASTYGINFNSNGFSIPAGASGNINSANNTYVYMAFANQF